MAHRLVPSVILPEFKPNGTTYIGPDDHVQLHSPLDCRCTVGREYTACSICRFACCKNRKSCPSCSERLSIPVGRCLKRTESATIRTMGCCKSHSDESLRVCFLCFPMVIPRPCFGTAQTIGNNAHWHRRPTVAPGDTWDSFQARLWESYQKADALYSQQHAGLRVECQTAINVMNSSIMGFMSPAPKDGGPEILPPPLVRIILSYHIANYAYFPIVRLFWQRV